MDQRINTHFVAKYIFTTLGMGPEAQCVRNIFKIAQILNGIYI